MFRKHFMVYIVFLDSKTVYNCPIYNVTEKSLYFVIALLSVKGRHICVRNKVNQWIIFLCFHHVQLLRSSSKDVESMQTFLLFIVKSPDIENVQNLATSPTNKILRKTLEVKFYDSATRVNWIDFLGLCALRTYPLPP